MSTIFSGASRYSTDFQSIIARAVSIASLHMNQLAAGRTKLDSESSALATLQTKFDSVRSSLEAIESSTGLGAFSTSVSHNGVVSLSLGEGVMEGAYTVRVTGLGANTTTMSKDGLTVVTDPAAAIISAGPEFTLTVNGTPVTITPSGPTLNALAEAINDASAGVHATIVNIGGPASPDYRLSLRGDAYDAVAISLSDGGTPLLDTLATGSKASYTVNGVAVETESRTVTLAPGITMTLDGESETGVDTTVTVSRSLASVKNALCAFVTSYNAAFAALDEHRGDKGGALSGDMLIGTLSDALRSVAHYEAASGDIANLAAVGLTFDEDGVLQFSASDFDAATAGRTDVLTDFLSTFMAAAGDTLEAIAGATDGVIASTSKSVKSMIERQDERIEAEQDRLDLYQKQLTARMSDADALIASLEQQVNYITGLFDSMRAASEMYGA